MYISATLSAVMNSSWANPQFIPDRTSLIKISQQLHSRLISKIVERLYGRPVYLGQNFRGIDLKAWKQTLKTADDSRCHQWSHRINNRIKLVTDLQNLTSSSEFKSFYLTADMLFFLTIKKKEPVLGWYSREDLPFERENVSVFSSFCG